MAQMPWGWGNLPAERGKGAGRPERCQARMTLPGSQTAPSTNQGMQGGVEPLRVIHREIPQEGHTLSPALLAVWFRGWAGPEGLRLCELLSAQPPLLLSLWSVPVARTFLPLDPIPLFGEMERSWPRGGTPGSGGWAGRRGASVGGRGGAYTAPSLEPRLFGFPFGDGRSPALPSASVLPPWA